MKLHSYRIAWAVGISAAGISMTAGFAACSSSSSPSSGNSSSPDGSTGACSNPNSLTIAFNPMYSAFIPGSTAHSFLVPAVVTGVSGANVQWSASDSTAVGFQNDPQTGGTTITVLKAGTVTINAQIGSDLCGSAPLTVTQETEDDWTAGNARYNNGVGLINPYAMLGDGGAGDAGIPQGPPPGGFMVPSASDPSPLEPADGGPGPACTNRHGATATGGFFQGIQHTPEQTAGFSDEDLTNIVVNGIIPDGGYYDSTILPYMYWQYFHKWRDLSPTEQKGIVVYLRSLTPSPQSGKIDFGGAFARGDGGAPPTTTGDDGGSTEPDAGSDTTTTDAGSDATPE
jgi:hypothetical protein